MESFGSGSLTTGTAMVTDVTTILKQKEFNLMEPLHIMNSNNIPETKTGSGFEKQSVSFQGNYRIEIWKSKKSPQIKYRKEQ